MNAKLCVENANVLLYNQGCSGHLDICEECFSSAVVRASHGKAVTRFQAFSNPRTGIP